MTNGKLIVWLFLSTEIMFFAGLIGTYIVLRFGASAWPRPHEVHLSESIGAFNTVTLGLEQDQVSYQDSAVTSVTVPGPAPLHHPIVESVGTFLAANPSEAVAGVLGLLSRSPLSREELAVRGLDALFASLGCSRARRRSLLLASAARKEAGPVYRERRDIILASLDDPCNAASAAIAAVGNKLEQLHLHERLTLAPDAIYRSFAHMHCNRLGLNAEAERLAYGLLVRAYDTLQAKEAGR